MAADRDLTEFNAPHLARFADLLSQAHDQGRWSRLLLVAYLLQANGYPAGAEPLPAEAARQQAVLPAAPRPG